MESFLHNQCMEKFEHVGALGIKEGTFYCNFS